jgi:hypothetical protein
LVLNLKTAKALGLTIPQSSWAGGPGDRIVNRRALIGTFAGILLATAAEAQPTGKVKRGGGRLLSIVALRRAGKCWRWLRDL